MDKEYYTLLALKETDVTTHNGALKQFNFLFVFQGGRKVLCGGLSEDR